MVASDSGKYICFVNGGEAAEIKLETLNFTKYDTVQATMSNVSADAVTDEKKGGATTRRP